MYDWVTAMVNDCLYDQYYNFDLSISMSGRPCLYWEDVHAYMAIDEAFRFNILENVVGDANKCR